MNTNRLDFLVIVLILIMIPHKTNAFFRVNPSSINVTRNITCRLNGNQTSGSNFQLCAIRVLQGTPSASVSTFILYNGFHYENTLRRYIQKRCNYEDYVSVTNTGNWTCNSSLPYETSLASVQSCVCSTDNCNIDIDSCERSIMSNPDVQQLVDIMPDLNSILQCSDTLNANNTCGGNPYIDVTLCQAYVKNNSVLCAITIEGVNTAQTSLIYENYEAYLDEKVYEVISAISGTSNHLFSESNNNVFYNYSNDGAGSSEECACTSYSFCNGNINTCASLNTSQIRTTMSNSSLTDVHSLALFDTLEATTNTITLSTSTTTSTTNIVSTTTTMSTESTMTTTTSTANTVSTTTTMSTESTMTTTSVESTTITTTTESIVTTTSTGFISTTTLTDSTTTTSMMAFIGTSEVTEPVITIQSTDSTTATKAPIIISSIPSSSTISQLLNTGESGLGRAATAGIACGIIFSAVIFIAEIVFFKFFYSGNMANGFDRSVRYQA